VVKRGVGYGNVDLATYSKGNLAKWSNVELDMAMWTWQLIAKATWQSGCGLS